MAEDIAQWLEGLGLGRYAQAFADNDVDAEVLSELTDADLKDLGFSLGHRRKLLKALADQDAGSTLNGPVHEPAPAPAPAEAERRQLTVLFCDIVGSTALSTRLDPEDMRELLRAYHDACSGVIARYDGYVAKFMGDGVYAYFGITVRFESTGGASRLTVGLLLLFRGQVCLLVRAAWWWGGSTTVDASWRIPPPTAR